METNMNLADLINTRKNILQDEIYQEVIKLQPELTACYTQEQLIKTHRDIGYHLSYLKSAIETSSPTLFAEYVAWVKIILQEIGIGKNAFRQELEIILAVLRHQLPDEYAPLLEQYLNNGMIMLSVSSETPKSYINRDNPQAKLADSYLDKLIHTDRHAATHLIMDAIDHGISIRDIYLNVFQPVQREIGRLWQMNKVSVALEHYCTAVTQSIMSQLYPQILSTGKTGKKFLAACIGNELHEIGVRMVTDFFELDGWDTYYLGANTPSEQIISTAHDLKVDLLGLSVTISFHIGQIADLIKQVKTSQNNPELKIIVGGYPFLLDHDLWLNIGADGFAPDASEAVKLGNSLMAV